MQSICIDYAEQTAQSRKANSSIMLNPSARDTKIVSPTRFSVFLNIVVSPSPSRKFVARNAASVIGDTTACCF